METHHGDVLAFRGRSFLLLEQPLEPYFDLIGQRPSLLEAAPTAGRGYAASWRIDDGWLYLLAVAGRWSDRSSMTLHQLFPFAGDRIFATWFSGTLHGFRLEEGKAQACPDARRYPDLVLTLDAGRMRCSSVVHRCAAAETGAAHPDVPAMRAAMPMAGAAGGSSLMV